MKKQVSAVKKTQHQSRYSDDELEEFCLLIKKKLTDTKEDLGRLSEDMKTCHPREKDYYAGLIVQRKNFVKGLENAIIRINNKNYGICTITGELIPKERLLACLIATTTINGKEHLHQIENAKKVATRARLNGAVPQEKYSALIEED